MISSVFFGDEINDERETTSPQQRASSSSEVIEQRQGKELPSSRRLQTHVAGAGCGAQISIHTPFLLRKILTSR